MAHGWLGSVLLSQLSLKTGKFTHFARISANSEVNKQTAQKNVKESKMYMCTKEKQKQKRTPGLSIQRHGKFLTCLAWLLLLLIFGSLLFRIPRKDSTNDQSSLFCRAPYLNNFGYGRVTIYHSLLKFGNTRVASRTKADLENRKNTVHAPQSMSLMVFLAGDIQLNPGPNADSVTNIQTVMAAGRCVATVEKAGLPDRFRELAEASTAELTHCRPMQQVESEGAGPVGGLVARNEPLLPHSFPSVISKDAQKETTPHDSRMSRLEERTVGVPDSFGSPPDPPRKHLSRYGLY